MAVLKIPTKTNNDYFNLQDFKDDFNALNDELANHSSQLTDSMQQLMLLSKRNYMRQPKTFFGFTGTKLIEPSNSFDNLKCGDPFVVFDTDNNVWRMFYYGYNTSAELFVLSATSQDLQTWTKTNSNLSLEGRTDRHKLSILVDEYGNPVKIDNKYHAYVVSKAPGKIIYHWETDNLANKWTETGAVITPNFANNGTDNYNVDAPCAVYDFIEQKVVLYYMGMPNSSFEDTGLGHRINRAVSDSPSSGFIYDGEVLKPSINPAFWYYGWIGGMQVLKIEKGYLVAFNAGKNRPSGVGNEDNPSAFGFGFMEDLYSPIKPIDSPSVQVQEELLNFNGYTDRDSIWRPHLVFDKFRNKYVCFYNTGDAGGQEWITYAIEGTLKISDNRQPILGLSTTKQIVPYTKLYLPPGNYKFTYIYNVYAGSDVNPIDVKLFLELNGAQIEERAVFVGSYVYENTNIIIETQTFFATQNSYIELKGQIVGGSPNIDAALRYGMYLIEAI